MTWRGRSVSEWMVRLGESGAADDDASSAGASQEVERIVRLIEQPTPKARRRTVLASSGLGLAAAAAAALWMLRTEPPAGPISTPALAVLVGTDGEGPFGEGPGRPLELGAPLESGKRLRGSASFRLRLDTGEDVVVERGSTVTPRLDGRSRSVALDQGGVQLRVPKKTGGETFEVVTKTTTVTVIGTAFRVWLVDEPAGRVTCVHVSEGRVRARTNERAALLGPGETFASDGDVSHCEDTNVEPSPPLTADDEPVRPRTTSGSRPSARMEKSSLPDENARFLEVVRAEREGRTSDVSRLRSEFLRRYPNSPFAPRLRSMNGRSEAPNGRDAP